MNRMSLLSLEDVIASEPNVAAILHDFESLPNSLRTLGHVPGLTGATLELWRVVMSAGKVEPELKYLVGYLSSAAAGCRYCSAHTAQNAFKCGASREKIEAIWEFERSPLFSAQERAALDFGRAAGLVPNAVEDRHFTALREHFDDQEIAELLAVSAIYGFFNRWNDSLATPLEVGPLEFGQAHLKEQGWAPEKHVEHPD